MTNRKQALQELLAKVEAGDDWAEVPGCFGYWVSSLGFVWSEKSNRLLSRSPCEKGYPMVHVLRDDGKRITRKVHILVMRAFRGEPSEGQEIRHLNGDKSDPSLANLKYGTRTENHYDRKRHIMPKSYRLRPADVIRIRERLSSGETCAGIARDYGVHKATIGDVKHRRRHVDVL